MNPLAFLHLSPGVGEVLLVLLVILILFGADQLPGIARSLGRLLHQMRHAADDFHDQLLDADRPLSPRNGRKTVDRTNMTPQNADKSAEDKEPPPPTTSRSETDSGAHDG